jgi:transposase
MLKSVGARFLFPPAYGPDLNPIEMAFSKLKAPIRKAAPDPTTTLGTPPDMRSIKGDSP